MVNWLSVFFACFVLDVVVVFYYERLKQRRKLATGFWSMVISLIGAYSVLSYNHDRAMLVPFALGNLFGPMFGIWLLERDDDGRDQ